MTTVSVRVDEELKRRMTELKGVDWSSYIREAIRERIMREEMKRACQVMDLIASKTPKKWSGARVIRRWRDSRYGSKGH
jgi:predicted DNA-binding protein